MITDDAMRVLSLGEAGDDPTADPLRKTVRGTIKALFDKELVACLALISDWRGPRRVR